MQLDISELFVQEKLMLLKKDKMKYGEQAVSTAQEVADRLLKRSYPGGMSFPIDVRGIVKAMGIGICEMNLNADRGFQLEKVNGYLRQRIDGTYEINIQNSDNEFTKRYVIAHELGHYLLNQAGNGAEDSHDGCQNCIDPLFAKNWNELLSDLLAAFILFPPELVLKHMKEYAERMEASNRYPMDASEWLRDLGQCAQVSYYFTIVCYQSLKLYMCCLYNRDLDDELIKSYNQFFK